MYKLIQLASASQQHIVKLFWCNQSSKYCHSLFSSSQYQQKAVYNVWQIDSR